jgi:disulfide bond formation protein DsbB
MKTGSWHFLLAAWLIALVATLGALFVGEVMGQAPCELCWYQRIAMFPLAWILGVAAFNGSPGYGWYALPLALVGAAVAMFHSLVYTGILPETIHQCGAGPSCTDTGMLLFGIPLPLLSLLSFAAIIVFLILSLRRRS